MRLEVDVDEVNVAENVLRRLERTPNPRLFYQYGEDPPDLDDRADRAGPFADEDGGLGSWRGSKLLWRTIKQAAGDYPAEAIKNNGIPAPYIHYLAYWWLRSRPDLLDQEAPTDLSIDARELDGRPQ